MIEYVARNWIRFHVDDHQPGCRTVVPSFLSSINARWLDTVSLMIFNHLCRNHRHHQYQVIALIVSFLPSWDRKLSSTCKWLNRNWVMSSQMKLMRVWRGFVCYGTKGGTMGVVVQRWHVLVSYGTVKVWQGMPGCQLWLKAPYSESAHSTKSYLSEGI